MRSVVRLTIRFFSPTNPSLSRRENVRLLHDSFMSRCMKTNVWFVLFALFLGDLPGSAAIITNTWIPVFNGVDYNTGQADTNEVRQQKVFVFRVDLQTSGLEFYSTPSNGTNAMETVGQTTTTFVNTYKVAFGMNANFFSPVSTIPNDPRDLSGLAVSGGVIVSPSRADVLR